MIELFHFLNCSCSTFKASDVEYVLTALRIHAAKQTSVVNARMNFNLRVQVNIKGS